MLETFHMSIKDIFFFRDGRTVLTGPIDEGEVAIIEPGSANVLIDGKAAATIQIEREMIPSRAFPFERLKIRALSTLQSTGLTKATVESHVCTLEGMMRYSGHRNLLGIDSPPAEFLADDMTLGPRLPAGWDGDAWKRPSGEGYFLRAWNKAQARYATALGDKFEEATTKLLDEIVGGGKKVTIQTSESAKILPSPRN